MKHLRSGNDCGTIWQNSDALTTWGCDLVSAQSFYFLRKTGEVEEGEKGEQRWRCAQGKGGGEESNTNMKLDLRGAP